MASADVLEFSGIVGLRMTLKDLLWPLLASEERGALRLACKDARRTVDELHDSAVLDVPAQNSDTTPSPTAVAAFHRHLNGSGAGLRRLIVRFNAGEQPHQYMADYLAAAGPHLPVTSCLILVQSGGQVQLAAFTRLVQALPQLQQLAMSRDDATAEVAIVTPGHMEALVELPQLHTLLISAEPRTFLQPEEARQPADLLDGIYLLKRLTTLRWPWTMYVGDWSSLSDELPALQHLGCSEWFGEPGAALRPPCLHTLSGPPSRDPARLGAELGGAAGRTLPPWDDAAADTVVVGISALEATPSLKTIRGAFVQAPGSFNGVAEPPAGIAAAAARFAACADAWSLGLRLWPSQLERLLAPMAAMAAGAWAPLRMLALQCASAVHTQAWQLMAQHALRLAPNLTALALELPGDEVTDSVLDLLPAMKALPQLQTLYLCMLDLGAEAMEASAHGLVMLLVALASSLTHPGTGTGTGTGGQGPRPCCRALQRVVLLDAPTAVVQRCNALLAGQGLAVRVGRCARWW